VTRSTGPTQLTGPTQQAGSGLQILPVAGIAEVRAGDNLAALLSEALVTAGSPLRDGDILVVSSKIVSKAEGRAVPAADRDEQVDAQSRRLVAARRTPGGLARIVEAAAGPVMAAAGVDNSNVPPGTVLLLPVDSDASARSLRADLRARTGTRIAVVVSDTAGRAWRDGQSDFALGCAGLAATEDLRGRDDTHGQRMEVTVRAVADELAAAADLVKGKLSGVPAAVVRGLAELVLASDVDGPGARVMLRPAGADWFRFGHVEAVRWAMGLDPATLEPPTVPAGPPGARLLRAVETALRAPSPVVAVAAPVCTVELHEDGLVLVPELPTDPVAVGALAERVRAACWSEDLTVTVEVHPRGLRVAAS